MPHIESLRLWMANLAIASMLIMAVALAASYAFHSLPKQHAALLSGILASLLAPLLVIFAWVFSLGQLSIAQSWTTAEAPPAKASTTISLPTPSDANATLPVIEQAPAEVRASTISPAKPAESSRIAQHSSEKPQTFSAIPSWSASTFHWVVDATLITWIFGTVVVLLFQVRNYFHCRKLLQSCRPVHSAAVIQALSAAAHHVGISAEIPLLSASGLPAPAVVGVITPTVLIPEDAETQFTPSQLHSILVHELAHIARRDHWMTGLTSFAQVLYWWNPVLYRMMRRISETREMICDDIASRASDASTEYAATIVGVAERSLLHSDAFASLGMGESSTTELEKRLKRILSSGNHAVEIGLSPMARFSTGLLVVTVCTTVLFAQVPGPAASALQAAPKYVENAEETRIVRGIVVSEDGKGVADAYVVLPLPSNQIVLETHTDQNGRFELKVPPHKLQRQSLRSIWAYSKLYSIGSSNPNRQISENSQEPLEIRLPPFKKASFQILSPAGEPVRDALVSPWDYQTTLGLDIMPDKLLSLFAIRTNAEGQVTLQGIDTQKLYTLSADHPLYGQQLLRMEWPVPNASQVTTRRMQLCQTGSIQGKLTGDPAYVGNVRIQIYTRQSEIILSATGQAEVLTDKQGHFQIPAIASGSIDAFIQVEDSWPVRPRVPQNARVEDGLPATLEIKLDQTRKVHGLVRGKKSQKPLSNLDISFRSGRLNYGVVTTDEHGKYEVNVLSGPIDFHVISSIPGYSTHLSRWQDAVKVPANTEGYELPVIELMETQELKGQLLSKQGQPLANKAVNAQKAFRTVGSGRTDKEGKFVMQIPEGLLAQLEFQVSDEIFDGRKTAIEQKDPLILRCTDDQEEQEAERLKRPDVALTGRVMLDDKPAAGVAVFLSRSIPVTIEGSREGIRSTRIGTFVTDDKGIYKLTGLKAGDHYHVEVMPYNSASPVFWQLNHSHPLIPIDTKSDLELPDALLIRLSQTLSGSVVDLEGKPLAGVHIAAQDENGNDLPWSVTSGQPHTVTDSEGNFQLARLPDVPLKLTAYRPGQAITRSLRNAAQKDVEKNQKDIRFVLDKISEVPKQ
ncbi:MAG: M56 family metallopeptidase [Planctomycetaceae bacterium]